MLNKKLIASSNNFGGIYRAILIDSGGDLRIVIPGLHDKVPVTTSDDGTYIFNVADYEKSKDSYPQPMWNVPNVEAQKHEIPIHPCWITFEGGNSRRPIIMGWLGKGIMYHASNSRGQGNSNSNGNNQTGDQSYVGGTLGVGDTLIVPEGYGTVCTYEKEIINASSSTHGWNSSTLQGSIRKDAISSGRIRQGDIFGLSNCAIIDDRLMIATKSNIGGNFPVTVGDYLDVEFSDGSVWNCILMDIKGADAPHAWGHNNGASVVEIIYWDYSYNSGNIYKKINKIVKVGRYE